MKRRWIWCVLTVMLCGLFQGVSGAREWSGEVIGTVYSSDILAYVNGHPVPSYNIGGKTVVLLDDIEENGYGFGWSVDESTKIIEVYAHYYMDYANRKEITVERGTAGNVLGEVRSCDYTVTLNGKPVQGYVIDGKLGLCVEEIGALNGVSVNEQYGYSEYLCNAAWDAQERTISLNTVGGFQLSNMDVPCIEYISQDNVLTAAFKPALVPYWDSALQCDQSGTFAAEPYQLYPLYLQTELGTTQVGLCYPDDRGVTVLCMRDIEQVRELVRPLVDMSMPYEQAIAMFNDGVTYRTLDSLELDHHTFLVVECVDKNVYPDWLYIAVQKSGGYYNVSGCGTHYTTHTIEKVNGNTVRVSVYPFAAMHGPTTMVTDIPLPLIGG